MKQRRTPIEEELVRLAHDNAALRQANDALSTKLIEAHDVMKEQAMELQQTQLQLQSLTFAPSDSSESSSSSSSILGDEDDMTLIPWSMGGRILEPRKRMVTRSRNKKSPPKQERKGRRERPSRQDARRESVRESDRSSSTRRSRSVQPRRSKPSKTTTTTNELLPPPPQNVLRRSQSVGPRRKKLVRNDSPPSVINPALDVFEECWVEPRRIIEL